MIKFLLIFTSSYLFCQIPGIAQMQEGKYLRDGDKLPDITLPNVLNYSTSTLRLSDFNGKLVILDFWSTNCASCIAAWPKLLELQKEFNGKIQIILVNAWEDEATVKQVFDRRKKIANVNMTLPAASSGRSILKLFNISGLPHIVWIDKEGFVKSTTYQSSLKSENIAAILRGGNPTMSRKMQSDEYIRADWSKPLFVNGNGGTPEDVMWQSTLTKGAPIFVPGMRIMESGITCTTASIGELYRFAYGNKVDLDGRPIMLMFNKVRFAVEDSTQYVSMLNGEIQFQNLFHYQLIVPQKTSHNELKNFMRSDLQKYFKLDVKWEKRIVKCLILSAEDTSLIAYKSGEVRSEILNGVKLNKVPLTRFITYLEDFTDFYFSPYPIVDETGFKGLLGDIFMDIDVVNGAKHEELDRALKKYKMHFTLQDRVVDVLVVRDGKLATKL